MKRLLVCIMLTGCAGSPPGAIHWQQVPAAPKPATDYFGYKGQFTFGRVNLKTDGTFTAYGCPSGQILGSYSSLKQAEDAIEKECGL